LYCRRRHDPTILELVTLLLGAARYNVIATTDAVAAMAMVRPRSRWR